MGMRRLFNPPKESEMRVTLRTKKCIVCGKKANLWSGHVKEFPR